MRYVIRDGALVPKHLAPPKHASTDSRRYVISDTMEPLKHMGTGRMLDSKSEFRKDTKAVGCEEAGNDPALRREQPRWEPSQHEVVSEVKRAIEQLRSR